MKQFALKHHQQLHFFVSIKLQISLGSSVCQFSFFFKARAEKGALLLYNNNSNKARSQKNQLLISKISPGCFTFTLLKAFF